MTILLQRLHDELVRRHYATTTRESYLKILKAFQRHIGKRLDHVGPNDLRRYQVYLLEDRRLAVGTVVAQLAALRFFYLRVLKRRHMKEDLPYPKRPRRLPIISREEVQRLIAGAQNLFHRTMLMTLYGGGLRRSELLHLKDRGGGRYPPRAGRCVPRAASVAERAAAIGTPGHRALSDRRARRPSRSV